MNFGHYCGFRVFFFFFFLEVSKYFGHSSVFKSIFVILEVSRYFWLF